MLGTAPADLPTVTCQRAALAWCAAEREVLLGCLRLAAAMADFFDRRGHRHDWAV